VSLLSSPLALAAGIEALNADRYAIAPPRSGSSNKVPASRERHVNP